LQALVQADCPLAIHIGDLERLQRYVDLLLQVSAKNTLEFWSVWGVVSKPYWSFGAAKRRGSPS